MSIKISVIVPLYNVENYIERTLNSLKNQNFKEFEILLINDGSKDKSVDVAEKILNNSMLNYKVINKENGGASSARNTGIDNAQGEYVYFLDGDDYIDPNMLDLMYKKIQNEKAEIVFCGYTHVKESNGEEILKVHKYIKHTIKGIEAAEKMLKNEFWISAISGMYSRNFLKENQLYFPTNIVFGEDTVFVVKALMNAEKVTCVEKALVYYVRRDTSVTRTANEKYFNLHESNMEILKYIRQNFKYEGINVEKSLMEYKIPQSIMRIFSSLAKSENCRERLLNFVKDKEQREYLKRFKINGQKENIKFKIASKVLLISPELMYKLLRK